MKPFSLALLIVFTFNVAMSQETFPLNGVKDKRDLIWYAFTNATIVTDYNTIIPNATLLIRDGVIEAVGAKVAMPKGAAVFDLKGKYIYPSFIDLYSSYGMPAKKENKKNDDDGPQMESSQKGPYNWNEAIRPDKKASAMFIANQKEAEEMRNLGFGAVLTHQFDGIARGSSTFVTLADANENNTILASEAAAHYSFSKGSSSQDYPSSLMGCIALIKQTYLDAAWHKTQASAKEYNISLDEWSRIQNLPQIFEVTDKLTLLRADKIGDEFNIQYIIKTNGDEYQRVNEIKATGAPLIVPINFPAAYDMEDPFDARIVSLEDLKHWEMAPANAAFLEKQGITFTLTLADLKDRKNFWKNLNSAVQHGLSSRKALQALTETPARLLKLNYKVGTLKPGMLANFIITTDSLFAEKNILLENWVQGKQYKIQDVTLDDIRGDYSLNIGSERIYKLKVSGEANQPSAEITYSDTLKAKANIIRNGELITLSFESDDKKETGNIRLSGKLNYKGAIWDGKGQLVNGTWINWSAVRKGKYDPKAKKDSIDKKLPELGNIIYPFTAYGQSQILQPEKYLIKNATIWTNEKEGVLKKAEVLINKGKIVAVGTNLDPAGAKIIDANGKHLTSGIIDEHSHIAISRGVNEGSQAVTSEVSIGDVINSEDINIYRQLAGGVTAAQLLHGSANPIGGQSGIIKLRWGMAPEQMKIKGVDGFIKFALGENVKQANWGDKFQVRFPQSRMGVEQVFYDAFIRAKEYELEWKPYNEFIPKKGQEKPAAPRRDLELDALVEILHKKRFISCHSYIQSEINMLMHVADSMGFKINTFTHILEGYKLADKMKEHGAGGSTFSDWWGYKFEVNDAIPYNASIMNKMGIVTAINSDDAEMGRRLNHEAAKAVKYGGVSEEDALKMITLNPAILLHLDDSMGSIKAGKDADLVLWSDHPLSIYAMAEKTFVDGVLYFDRERDLILREEMKKERARLTNKMIQAKKEGEKTQKPEMKKQTIYHCETLEESEVNHIH